MARILSLLVVVLLGGLLFTIPDPPAHGIAALQAGTLVGEPSDAPLTDDWRRELGPGDRVRLDDGREGLVTGEDEGGWLVDVDGEEFVAPPATITERTERSADMWRALLASPAATRAPDGSYTLRIAGCKVTSRVEAVDPAAHGRARESVRRALRSRASDEGIQLEILGNLMPYKGEEPAVGIEVLAEHDQLTLGFALPAGPRSSVSRGWLRAGRSSLFPPLIAIIVAILFRRPIAALLAGVLAGAVLARWYGGAGAFASAGQGALDVLHPYFTNELLDRDRQLVVLFVLFMLAMVGVMTRSGGLRGLMDMFAARVRGVRGTLIGTWAMGLAVFFDDYANTILVGTTMRPLTDRVKIAREKLAYVVDSTAAPVAGISIFSTWIAFEVSTFSAQLPDVGLSKDDGYGIFIETLPYRFYCLFALALVGLVVFMGRDFGPMLTAERRARRGKVLRDGATPLVSDIATKMEAAPGVPHRASNALVPIFGFVLVTLLALFEKGGAFGMGARLFSLEGISDVLADGDSFRALALGSGCGLLLAIFGAMRAGILAEVPRAAWVAVRSMIVAVGILYLAWMIGAVCGTLGTAPYLTALLGDAVPAPILPCALFILSGIVAFSTGSSWSTMSILLPLVVTLSFNLGEGVSDGSITGHALMILSIGAVLEGAIFGDHCSPISDTTVMSSIASASDHIDHVRTQAPYAVLTMVVALVIGYFPCTFLGLHPLLALVLGIAIMATFLRLYGKRPETDEATPA